MEGRRFGPYRLVAELGSGAQATVHLAEVVEPAEGLRPGDRVALKILHEHLRGAALARERFQREIRLLKAIDHPNVVRLLDAGVHVEDAEGPDRHYLATELVEGVTLRRLVRNDGALAEALCRFVGREVAKGIGAIHDAGAVHRDLKPENVILTQDQKVKVMDLGVALLRDEGRVSETGDFIGSVLYAAPEQFLAHEREVDGRADLYALGLVLFEMLTGRHPFQGEGLAAVMTQHLKEPPPRPSRLVPAVSPFFETLVLALLAKLPSDRPARASLVVEALETGETSSWWRGHEKLHLARTRLYRPRTSREYGLTGRGGELERLSRLWSRARRGDGRVALVVGEAGIGKTRVVDEFAENLHVAGEEVTYLYGSSLAGGAATAAGAFTSAFLDYLGRSDPEGALRPLLLTAPALVAPFASFLLGVPPPAGTSLLGPDGIHTAFIRVAQALAGQRPTMLVIDDLHFAPPEGRALFAALAQAVAGHRILLVGLSRPGLPADYRAGLQQLPHAEMLELGRLGPQEIGLLLEDALGSRAAAGMLVGRIQELTDGNPFFIRETLRAQRESGGLRQKDDGTWTLQGKSTDLQAPSVVKEIVAARMADLGERDRELMDVAAVCGFRFDPAVLAEVLETPRLGVLRDLGRLERTRQLVVADGHAYRFDHHLVQETVYEVVPELLRREYHAAVGAVLSARIEDPTDVAAPDVRAVEACFHLLRGDRGGQALRLLEPALAYLEANSLHQASADLLGDVLRVPGLVEGRRRAELGLERIRHLGYYGSADEVDAAVRDAIEWCEAVGDADLLTRVRIQRVNHLLAVGRLAEAAEDASAARASAGVAGDAAVLADACNISGTVELRQGRWAEAVANYRRVLELAREVADPRREALAHGNLAQPLAALGEMDAAFEEYRVALEMFERVGGPREQAISAGNYGNQLRLTGRYREAAPLLARALEVSRQGGYRGGEVNALGNLAAMRYTEGRLAETLDLLDRAEALSAELGNLPQRLRIREMRGMAEYRLGRLDAAWEILEDVVRQWDAIGVETAKAASAYMLAEIASCRGEHDDAVRRVEAVVRAASTRGEARDARSYDGSLGLFLLRAGRMEEAVVHLEASLSGEAAADGDVPAVLAALGRRDPEAVAAELARWEDRAECYTLLSTHLWLGRATGRADHFRRAHAMLEELVQHAPESAQAGLTDRLPLYREIEHAWRNASGSAPTEGVGGEE